MTTFTKFCASVLTVALLLVSLPHHASAQLATVPTWAPATDVILGEMAAVETEESFVEQVLNGIAWAAAKAVVQSITQSLVTWINSGFQGSPAFVTNLNQNLRQVADGVANKFLQDLVEDTGKDDWVESPFAEQVAEGIATGFYLATSGERLANRLQYTLQRFTQNPNQFLYGDFSQGGWNAWYQTNSRCGNNVYCFQIAAHDELIARVESQIDQRLRELEYGNGFLSWRGDCNDGKNHSAAERKNNPDVGSVDAEDLSDADRQSNCKILTPGSVIESQLEHTLGSSVRQLELADSINEIIGALASQLVSQVIGNSGLLGANDSPSGGGSSYVDAATNESNNNASSQGTSLASQFDTFTVEVQGYKSNWQKVRTAADAAKAKLESCLTKNNNEQRLAQQVTPVFTQADAAITEADEVLPLIEEAKVLATANPTQASTRYTTLRARITAGEVAAAASNATENPSTGASLYLDLQALSENGCSNSDDNDGLS